MLNTQLNKNSLKKFKTISLPKNLQLNKFKNQMLHNQLKKKKNLKE